MRKSRKAKAQARTSRQREANKEEAKSREADKRKSKSKKRRKQKAEKQTSGKAKAKSGHGPPEKKNTDAKTKFPQKIPSLKLFFTFYFDLFILNYVFYTTLGTEACISSTAVSE